jgi:polysaccharide export outer membrane protein
LLVLAVGALSGLFVSGCTRIAYPPASAVSALPDYTYHIGPGDSITVFVWRNQELSTTVSVRPDGKITVPLVEDLPASGKTPSQLARDIEKELAIYVREPIVTVIVAGGVGPYNQQVRVLGEAAKPQTLAYKQNMTLLDVMIEVGGLTQYAAGNQASIVRFVDGKQRQLGVRLEDLIRSGDISANVQMFPGDILIIPESWF